MDLGTARSKRSGDARVCVCLRIASDARPGLIDERERGAREAARARREDQLAAGALPELSIDAADLTICTSNQHD